MIVPHMNNLEELVGTVERIVFSREENGYAVIRLKINALQQATACGSLAHVHEGEQVHLRGAWKLHPTFGRQFEVQECTATAPTSIAGLVKYLGSGQIKGIGPVYAQKIVDRFGLETLSIIENQPELLESVPGIGPTRASQIITSWHNQKHVAHIALFLQEHGCPRAFASRIYKKYGTESLARIKENPYRLGHEVWGIGFKTADELAQRMGLSRTAPERIRAGIRAALMREAQEGSLYSPFEKAINAVATLLVFNDSEHELIKQECRILYTNEQLTVIPHNGKQFLSLPHFHATEKAVAHRLFQLKTHQSLLANNENLAQTIQQLETTSTLTFEQRDAIQSALTRTITVVSGGPGTGKTTLVRELIKIAKKQNIRHCLAAPTGRAAKRMIESTGAPATTLHRLLEFDPHTMRFGRNAQNGISAELIIVDELSMIDIFLMHALVHAIKLGSHILLLGDSDQLPSVGPGNVLADIIGSGTIAYIRLTHIFRQAAHSMIITNAHRINSGLFPLTDPAPEKKPDFIFISERDPANIFIHIKDALKRIVPQHGLKASDITVLSPMHRGGAGTHALNQQLQEFLNDFTASSLTSFGTSFKVNDRVIQLRNNYDKEIFNGDIGIVSKIDESEQALEVTFEGKLITYSKDELSELSLAYALSIHKSQGSEYPAIIIPFFMQHFMLLRKKLLYTAVTRAQKLCIVIGDPKAIGYAIKQAQQQERLSLLKQLLIDAFACA